MRGETLTSIEKGAHFYCVWFIFFLVEKRIKRAALSSPSFFMGGYCESTKPRGARSSSRRYLGLYCEWYIQKCIFRTLDLSRAHISLNARCMQASWMNASFWLHTRISVKMGRESVPLGQITQLRYITNFLSGREQVLKRRNAAIGRRRWAKASLVIILFMLRS